ncbi:uncharacterized protein FIBRA_04852 [Fibroporia radiculosa]|uniref:CBM21 domain-containing protein n=1 Tax=Fibroporia radiculosa TaxID=599839 RepID=J4H367_9APHY|nr:uncharacterized protein FIBRA_04852 [Fibroporia radiculosa]CCM02744.1 predicted protein [Fibroporia radiculosa]
MPYAVPAQHSPPSTTVTTTSPRTAHRRTRSAGNFSDERGPGAFTSLGTLPRSHKKAVFHIDLNDDDSPPEDSVRNHAPPPRPASSHSPSYTHSPTNSLRLSMNSGKFSPSINPPPHIDIPPFSPASVPFPTTSPLSPTDSASPFFASRAGSSRPSSLTISIPRTPSTPIILSNGKPLKPSLKSSNSSPNIPDALTRAGTKHLRAQSAPSTPAGPKNVHFAEKDQGLETVRVFSRSGKPASLSKPPGDETETETEVEVNGNALGLAGQNAYPFPSLTASAAGELPLYEIDASPERTSSVPVSNPSPYANVHLETLALPRTRPPALRGTVLVRNIAFEKRVAVRFTLDEWQTTSEVSCRHVVSLPSLPPPFPHAKTVGDLAGSIANGEGAAKEEEGRPSWDRFSFTIRLEDYEHKLAERTLFMVVRYSPGTGGEWWDNNGGSNFRVGFRRAPASPKGHSLNMAGMGMGMGVGFGHSQQRTFSAPSTLKTTPMTATVVGDRVDVTGAEAAAVASAAVEADKEKTKNRVYAAPLLRSFSSPLPSSPPTASTSGSRYSSGRTESSSLPTSPAQAFISKRLSLSNYVAPGMVNSSSMMTPPTTPPNGGSGRSRSSSLPGGAGMSSDASGESSVSPDALGDKEVEQVAEEGHDDESYEREDAYKGSDGASFPGSYISPPAATISGQPAAGSLASSQALEPLDFKLPWAGMSGFGADMGLGFELPSAAQEQLLSPPSSPVGSQQALDSGDRRNGSEGQDDGDAQRRLAESSHSSSSSSIASADGMSYSVGTSGSPGASFRERDSNYAALIRQWCFSGSPSGSSVGSSSAVTGAPFAGGVPAAFSASPPGKAARAYGPAGYGFPGFGFGMVDAGMVGDKAVRALSHSPSCRRGASSTVVFSLVSFLIITMDSTYLLLSAAICSPSKTDTTVSESAVYPILALG